MLSAEKSAGRALSSDRGAPASSPAGPGPPNVGSSQGIRAQSRSGSAALVAGTGHASVNQTTGAGPSKYKSKVCIFWLQPEGCPYGERCFYAHGAADLKGPPGPGVGQPAQANGQAAAGGQTEGQGSGGEAVASEQGVARPKGYKTQMCRHWQESRGQHCPHGIRCTYAHGSEERALYLNLALAATGQADNEPKSQQQAPGPRKTVKGGSKPVKAASPAPQGLDAASTGVLASASAGRAAMGPATATAAVAVPLTPQERAMLGLPPVVDQRTLALGPSRPSKPISKSNGNGNCKPRGSEGQASDTNGGQPTQPEVTHATSVPAAVLQLHKKPNTPSPAAVTVAQVLVHGLGQGWSISPSSEGSLGPGQQAAGQQTVEDDGEAAVRRMYSIMTSTNRARSAQPSEISTLRSRARTTSARGERDVEARTDSWLFELSPSPSSSSSSAASQKGRTTVQEEQAQDPLDQWHLVGPKLPAIRRGRRRPGGRRGSLIGLASVQTGQANGGIHAAVGITTRRTNGVAHSVTHLSQPDPPTATEGLVKPPLTPAGGPNQHHGFDAPPREPGPSPPATWMTGHRREE